jgi:hypothetical protein
MENKMSWKIKIPLATNPIVLIDLVKLFVITFLVIVILFAIILGTQDGFDSLLPMIGIMGLVCLGLLVLCFLIMLIFFGNKFEVAYELEDDSVTMHTIDKRAKLANRIATGAGILGGNLTTSGAGILAMTSETISYKWSWIQGFNVNRLFKTITLRNSWRNVMSIYCGNDFDAVLDFVKDHVQTSESKKKSPLLAILGWTVLILLASLLTFFEYPAYFRIELFSSIFVMLFAVASLWLIPLLSYATLAGILWMVGQVVYWGVFENNFQYVYETEWIPFIILGIGLSFLVWISIALLRGKIVSMLLGDQTGKN